jgi:hypothetical protein
MRPRAVLGASLIGTLGGSCVLVYHPGDYTIASSSATAAGGGGQATTSGSGGRTTSSGSGAGGTGGTGGQTATSTSTGDAGGGVPTICDDIPSAGSDCLRPVWQWTPVGASGEVDSVALHGTQGAQGVDTFLAGQFAGTLAGQGSGDAGVLARDGGTFGFVAWMDMQGATRLLDAPTEASMMNGIVPRAGSYVAVGDMAGQAALFTTSAGALAKRALAQAADGSGGLGHAAAILGDVGDISHVVGTLRGSPDGGSLYCGVQPAGTWPQNDSLYALQLRPDDVCAKEAMVDLPLTTRLSSASLAQARGLAVLGGTYVGTAVPDFAWVDPATCSATCGFVAGLSVKGLAVKPWAISADAGSFSSVHAVAVGGGGDIVYALGTFAGNVSFAGGAFKLSSVNNSTDSFLVRISLVTGPQVTGVWQFGGSHTDSFHALAVVSRGAADTVFLGGPTWGQLSAVPLSFGSGPQVCADPGLGGGIVVLRMEIGAIGDPIVRWAQCLGTTGENGTDLVQLASDGTYLAVAGARHGGIGLGQGTQTLDGPFAALFATQP